jgi:beta-alanine--pyruvate transaminase
VYETEGSFAQALQLEPVFENAIHELANHPKVIDVRNFGLMGAIELAPHKDGPGLRGIEVHKRCFWDEDLVVRNGGDTLQFSPFLNAKADDILMTFQKVRRVLDTLA